MFRLCLILIIKTFIVQTNAIKYRCGCLFATGCYKTTPSCCPGLVCVNNLGSTQCLEASQVTSKVGCVQTNQNGCSKSSDCCNPYAVCTTYKNCILNATCNHYYTSPDPSNQPTRLPSLQPQSKPSCQPSNQPLSRPSRQPTRQPSRQPMKKPVSRPSSTPTQRPFDDPTFQPSCQPTLLPQQKPSSRPSEQPFQRPSSFPSGRPSIQPQIYPTSAPSTQPSFNPSLKPSSQPLGVPTKQPNMVPSRAPSHQPNSRPSIQPMGSPSEPPSQQPSKKPSQTPSNQPIGIPTSQSTSLPSTLPSHQPHSSPSSIPSIQPSAQPSHQPLAIPTDKPTNQPFSEPSAQPTSFPTRQPSFQPFYKPTYQPTGQPVNFPSMSPNMIPTKQPTNQPSNFPTFQPFSIPSKKPTDQPLLIPTGKPSRQPAFGPSIQPTGIPSQSPSQQTTVSPSRTPSHGPTSQPSIQPYSSPTSTPSHQPTTLPTSTPSVLPTSQPFVSPTIQPSTQPIELPTSSPSALPTLKPSYLPSGQPTCVPSFQPVVNPTTQPLRFPTSYPTDQPFLNPSTQPITFPSQSPTILPSSLPSVQPSEQPQHNPTQQPVVSPSEHPSNIPSYQPSMQPISHPSCQPSRQPNHNPTQQPLAHPSKHPVISPSCQPRSSVLPMATSISPAPSPSAALMYSQAPIVYRIFNNTPSGKSVAFDSSFIVINVSSNTFNVAHQKAFIQTVAKIQQVADTAVTLQKIPSPNKRRMTETFQFEIQTTTTLILTNYLEYVNKPSDLVSKLFYSLQLAVYSGGATSLFRAELIGLSLVDATQPAIVEVVVTGHKNIAMKPTLSPTIVVLNTAGGSDSPTSSKLSITIGVVCGMLVLFCFAGPLVYIMRNKINKKKALEENKGIVKVTSSDKSGVEMIGSKMFSSGEGSEKIKSALKKNQSGDVDTPASETAPTKYSEVLVQKLSVDFRLNNLDTLSFSDYHSMYKEEAVDCLADLKRVDSIVGVNSADRFLKRLNSLTEKMERENSHMIVPNIQDGKAVIMDSNVPSNSEFVRDFFTLESSPPPENQPHIHDIADFYPANSGSGAVGKRVFTINALDSSNSHSKSLRLNRTPPIEKTPVNTQTYPSPSSRGLHGNGKVSREHLDRQSIILSPSAFPKLVDLSGESGANDSITASGNRSVDMARVYMDSAQDEVMCMENKRPVPGMRKISEWEMGISSVAGKGNFAVNKNDSSIVADEKLLTPRVNKDDKDDASKVSGEVVNDVYTGNNATSAEWDFADKTRVFIC